MALAADEGWTKSQLMGGVEESAIAATKKGKVCDRCVYGLYEGWHHVAVFRFSLPNHLSCVSSCTVSVKSRVWQSHVRLRSLLLNDGQKGEVKGLGVDEDPMLWGRPGHLTSDEADTYFKFKATVEESGADFKDTVFSFGEEEGEVYALTRWLRARKYVYDDVITMVQAATDCRKEAKSKDYYPNPVDALGCEASLFFSMYPQLYTGFAKNGAPIYISKPGILNVDGMEQATTLEGIIKFHWYIMMHDFANRLRQQKKKEPEKFKRYVPIDFEKMCAQIPFMISLSFCFWMSFVFSFRFECFCILDLNGLSTSQLSRRALAIIKEQSAIDSVCFPETMSYMLIVNAPTFFSATWRLIKGWLDPRTVGKIEVISSKAAGEKRMLELIDNEQLPSDYGGAGPDTNETLAKGESFEGHAVSHLETKMVYLRGHGSEVVSVAQGESLQVTVFTRSTAGATFSLHCEDNSKKIINGIENILVQHGGTDDPAEKPTEKHLNTEHIKGPMKMKVKADSKAGRFSTQNFLLVFSYYKE